MKILNKLSAALKNTNAKKNDENDTYTPILAEEDYPFKSDVEIIEMPKSSIKPVETQKNAEIHIIQFTENKPVEVQRVSLNKEQAYKMGWHYKRKSSNCLRITRYTGKIQDIILPAEIEEKIPDSDNCGRGGTAPCDPSGGRFGREQNDIWRRRFLWR